MKIFVSYRRDDSRDAVIPWCAQLGPRWLTVVDSRGRRRIDDRDDAVRMEVGGALASRRPTMI